MKKMLALLSALLLALPVQAGFEVGERVWIGLYSDNLQEDGYAVGEVEAVRPDGTLSVIIKQLVEGKGRTLYGTCHPGGTSPLAGAEIIDDRREHLRLRKEMAPSEVQPWQEGKHEFMDREQLATVFDRWQSDTFGLTSYRLRLMADKARGLQLPQVAAALELAALEYDARGEQGFPLPLEVRLGRTAAMLEAVEARLESQPAAVLEEMRLIVRGLAEGQGLEAMAAAKILRNVAADLQELRSKYADFAAAENAVADLRRIHFAYADIVTLGGAVFEGRDAGQWRQHLEADMTQGWPSLP